MPRLSKKSKKKKEVLVSEKDLKLKLSRDEALAYLIIKANEHGLLSRELNGEEVEEDEAIDEILREFGI